MPERVVTLENLGGWIFKCNPQKWDFRGFVERNGSGALHSWSVKPSYRTELMEPGQRVWLWVSGPEDADIMPGIWGSGYLTGEARWDIAPPSDDDSEDVWIDKGARDRAEVFAQCEINIFDHGYPRSVMKSDPRLAQMELFRSSMMSNPVFVSCEEAAALDEIIGPPGDVPDPVPEETVISAYGAGWGDPYLNTEVEWAAMDFVADAYEADGWTVEDVSPEKVGWDITARRDGQTRHIEVKGLSGHRPHVLLTRNEHATGADDADWMLAVVTRALHKPTMIEYDYAQVKAASAPYVYKAMLD